MPGVDPTGRIRAMNRSRLHPRRRQSRVLAAGVLALLAAATAGPWGSAHALQLAPREPVLRIALAGGLETVEISSAGAIRVWRRGTGLAGSVIPAGASLGVAARPGGTLLVAAGDTLGVLSEELLFEPLAPEQPLRLDGRPYRGELLVRTGRQAGLDVINAIGIEEYLQGVVPLEIGSGNHIPAAALRAQAIAARSYSLHFLGRRQATHGCDLLATIEDQVYGGAGVETPEATQAVIQTRGIVAVHEGRPIRANYCSTCGGHTASAGEVWPGDARPYLRATKDEDGAGDPWCSASRHARWEECWDCASFTELVLRHLPEEDAGARGKDLGRLRDVRVVTRSASGRATELRIITDGGRFVVRGDRIRWLLRRPDDTPLRSTLIGSPRRVEEGGTCQIRLEGRGNGHGVGLCQTGAIERARRGETEEGILRRYYRGIALVRWW